jgi:high-affinity Fe2+/Pb2+ permease
MRSDNSSKGQQLIDQGQKRIFLHVFLFGIPLLILLLVAGLQYVGILHLQEYFAAHRPESVDEGAIYRALALAAALLALLGGSGIVRGIVTIRRENNRSQ